MIPGAHDISVSGGLHIMEAPKWQTPTPEENRTPEAPLSDGCTDCQGGSWYSEVKLVAAVDNLWDAVFHIPWIFARATFTASVDMVTKPFSTTLTTEGEKVIGPVAEGALP